jgi:hypothetical protein
MQNNTEVMMVHPAVLILNSNHEIVYFWKAEITPGSLYGAKYPIVIILTLYYIPLIPLSLLLLAIIILIQLVKDLNQNLS